MFVKFILIVIACGVVVGFPYFETKRFRVGIEYEHSLPMYGGSDRYRHRNNYDPFFVTVTANVKVVPSKGNQCLIIEDQRNREELIKNEGAPSAFKGFVISYVDITATVDVLGEVDFNVIRGTTGSKTMVFQLVSNHSDFLAYTYLAYGIREEEYKKVNQASQVPLDYQYNISTPSQQW